MAPQLLAWSHDMVAIYRVRRDRAIEDLAEAATVAFTAWMRALLAERTAGLARQGGTPDAHTDVVALTVGERVVLETRFAGAGRYMSHPHQARMAERGAMGWIVAG